MIIMREILILCTSPYQLLVASQLKEQVFKEDKVSIAVGDTIANVSELFSRLKLEKVFEKTYLWKIKGVVQFGFSEKVRDAISYHNQSNRYTVNLDGLDKRYDIFLYANISRIAGYVVDRLMTKNRDLSVQMFEDGFSTYSTYTGNYLEKRSIKHWFTRRALWKTRELFIFNPDIMAWKPSFHVTKISSDYSKDSINRINRIFGYDLLKDDYSKRVIFFEESYSADGKTVDDVDLLEEIAKVVGKENIIVKIHPRNPTNRFSEHGFVTNTNTSIPWEVILINGDFSESIFVTMASNAAMNPFFLFGKSTPAFLLFKCSKTPEAMYKDIIEFDEQLCSKYPEVFYIPASYEEMLSKIESLTKETKE